MTYKVCIFMWDTKDKMRVRRYVTVQQHLTWERAKEVRHDFRFSHPNIVPERAKFNE